MEQRDLRGQTEKQKTLIGITPVRQKGLRAFHRLPHAFAAEQFLEFVAKLDPSVSGYVNPGKTPKH